MYISILIKKIYMYISILILLYPMNQKDRYLPTAE